MQLEGYSGVFSSFDTLSAIISSLFNKATLLETTTKDAINNISIFTTNAKIIKAATDLDVGGLGGAQLLANMRSQKRKLEDTQFGRKTNKLSRMSNEELKTKLKSVGILVTKLSKSGKRLNLTRKEMEKKANLFKNLQLRAKKMGIKIMYKSRTRGYVYKSYNRLMNEIEKTKTKTKRASKRVSKFG